MTAGASWTAWGLDVSLVLTGPDLLADAEHLVREVIASVDDACSRFRPDSELMLLQPVLSHGVMVSPLLAHLVRCAIDSARISGGDVDPTLGKDLELLGYDRDISQVRLGTTDPYPGAAPQPRRPGWEQIILTGQLLTVPKNLHLDLGATAKAVASDWAAARVFDALGCGVLVSLGGDIATAGAAPDGGWQVMVQDLPGDPEQQVTLEAGQAMATSSTQKRRWTLNGVEMHHILDPRFGLPVEPVWRSLTVAAASCLLANTYSTAGIVRGFAAVRWLENLGVAGRCVDQQYRVVTTGAWPTENLALKGVETRG